MIGRSRLVGLAVLAVVALVAAAAPAGAGGSVPAAKKVPTLIAMTGFSGGPSLFSGTASGSLHEADAPLVSSSARVKGTAINASGSTALVADDLNSVAEYAHLPSLSKVKSISLHQFAGEGGASYAVTSLGVATAARTALVTVGEQGVVQLRETGSTYAVDTRVHSTGKSEAGKAHAAGFIRIPGSSGVKYDGVAVSSVPLANGKYLGIVISRQAKTLAVIEGVGSADPKVVGQITSPDLAHTAVLSVGNDGMVFSPATAERAIVMTYGGVDVLNLTHPANPVLQSVTTAGEDGETESVAVDDNGDTVALANQGIIFYFTGLLTRPANKPLAPAGQFVPGLAGYGSYALAFTSNDQLVDLHNAFVSGNVVVELSAYSGKLTAPTVRHSVLTNDSEPSDNQLTVFPPAGHTTLDPATFGSLRKGKAVKVGLSVAGGVGSYQFTVSAGTLPKGLHLAGNKITGTPKKSGKRNFTIEAVNKYGGAVFRAYTVTVKSP